MRSECRENIAKVECILGVSVEVGAGRQSWCGHPADHGTVAQDRKAEGVAVERHELRGQLGDLVTECADKLLLGPLTDVGRAERIHRPVIAFAVSDERTNANDGVIDVLWEPVAENLTNVRIRLASEVIGGSEAT
jgi:hypothetical protein